MFIRSGDLVIHVQVHGPVEAPPLLLLHSLGATNAVWDAQAEALATRHRVIRPDLRGHGLTGVPSGPYGIVQLARDALAVLDALDVGRAHVGGLSIGGIIAQALAAAAPGRVASLMLCDTALAVPPAASWHERAATVRAQGMAAIADAVMARWITPAFAGSPEAAGLRQMLLRTDPEGYAAACGAIAADDRTSATSALAVPALVLVGEHDQSTPVAAAQALRDAIAGASLVVVPGAAHIAPVEQAAAVSDALARFLHP